MKASAASFGIEIESGIPQSHAIEFPAGPAHTGIQLPGMPNGWTGQRDGSIQTDYGYIGVELVSPVLKGERGLVEIVYLCDYLDSIGALHNQSMGLHVHVGAKEVTQAMLRPLASNFRHYERALYGLNGTTAIERWNNHYCPNSGSWYRDLMNYGSGIGNPSNETYPHLRYRGLNLTTYNPTRRKHTIEFRLWTGNHNPAMVICAAYMAVSLVTATVNGLNVPDDRPIMKSTVAAREFNRDIWNAGGLNNRIIPDVDNSDQTRELFRNCRVSGL